MIDLRLAPGRERSVLAGHPWVFSGALQELPADLPPGSLVRLFSASGEFIARGYANPRCSIAVRVLTRRDEPIDRAFLARRIRRAAMLRRTVVGPDSSAWRLINGEGDGLPGFVVDRYGDVLVLQCLTAGAERLRDEFASALAEELQVDAIYEKSSGSVRRAEGLSDRQGWVFGHASFPLRVRENGLSLLVDPSSGQKTGMFLDQRGNHALVRRLAGGLRVADVFCYTGGFAVHAAAGGARRVVALESSASAVAAARCNFREQGANEERLELIRTDARRWLRAAEESFDLIILDPPALARHRHEVPRASRAYRELNRLAIRRLQSPGWLLTFTCSQHISAELFTRLVATAAGDERRDARIVYHLGAGPDHPVPAAQPEAQHLKGLLLQVD